MTEPDDLRRRLDDIAGSVDIGDLDVQAVRSNARRRRLRVRLGATIGVMALAVGGTVAVVAYNAGDEPDTLATADVDEPDSTDTPSSTIEETPPPIELPAAPERSVATAEGSVVVGQQAGVGGAPEYGEWSAAWHDGFLVGAQSFTPQPLPDELPDEVVALFPQEVLDVFGGELPPTISEATKMLSDAGLLDTVADIIADNPEASAAIYSAQTDEAPTLDVRFTADGVTWEPIEMTLPPGASYLNGVTTVDDRLVVSYGLQDPQTGGSIDGTVRVATTENLLDWNVQEIVIPPPPLELPAGSVWSVYLGGLAANETGWAASVYANVQFDPIALVPDEVRADFQQSADGYSSMSDDTGITIERWTGGESETVDYTWEELGIAPEVGVYLAGQQDPPTVWAATWEGVPTAATGPAPTERMLATPAGFVGFDDQIRFSADGLTWTAEPLPVDEAYVMSAFTFDGGIIAFVDTRDGARTLRLDERGGSPQWVDIPGMPEHPQSPFGFGSKSAVILDSADVGPPRLPLVVEADGHRLTIDSMTGSVEVVDLATDEIIATADVRRGLDQDGPVQFDNDGVTVTDPATGSVVVNFPAAALEAANEALYEPSSPEQEYQPDLWLLGTLDGETFVLEDLDDGSGESFFGPGGFAVNGSRLLLQAGGNWLVYDLA